MPDDAPKNVKFRQIDFSAYCLDVSHKLGIKFSPQSPYKLCDLKPAFGYVHSDDLVGYDFWGFSDIDLVYGDLRNYFSDARLSSYDLLSTHERRVSGHLCLLRNNSVMRECFMRVPEWQEMLADPQHNAFDESAFTRLFIRHKNWPEWLQRIASLNNPLRQRSEFTEAFSTPCGRIPWHDDSMNFPAAWIWQDGQLRNEMDGRREFPYFHFIGWKDKAPWRQAAEASFLANPALAKECSWQITAQGFTRCNA